MNSQIRKIANEQIGSLPKSVEKIEDGLKHETYSVETEDDDFIVQFSGIEDEENSTLGYCLDCYKMLKDSDIPVPKNVTKGPQNIDGREYIVVEKLPGETINQDITPEKVKESGNILAKLHCFKTFQSEGWLNFEGGKPHMFEEGGFKQRILKKNEESIQKFRDKGEEYLADQLEEYFEQNHDKIPEDFEPVLYHGDYSADNVLWKDGEVTGVIDFDYARASYWLRDLARSAIGFWMEEPNGDWKIRKTFYEGYQEKRQLGENFEQEKEFWEIQTLSNIVSELIEMGELSEEEIEIYRKRIMKLVDEDHRTSHNQD